MHYHQLRALIWKFSLTAFSIMLLFIHNEGGCQDEKPITFGLVSATKKAAADGTTKNDRVVVGVGEEVTVSIVNFSDPDCGHTDSDAMNSNVTWSSSDEGIATVSGSGAQATVYFRKVPRSGSVTITATVDDQAKDTDDTPVSVSMQFSTVLHGPSRFIQSYRGWRDDYSIHFLYLCLE